MEEKIKTMLLGDHGICRVDVTFQKDVFSPGEKVAINCRIDNSQCSKAIERITVFLKRHIDYRFSNGVTHSDKHTVITSNFPGVPNN